MMLKKEIFREYDIRGIYNEDMDDNTAYLIGKAFGSKLRRINIPTTVVAYDNRLSSVSLEEALVRGIVETGTNVIRLGLATTPMCNFASNYLKTNCNLMITASHNPKEYNGFKFSYNGIHFAYGDSIKEIYEIISSNNFESGQGTIENYDISEKYIDLLVSRLEFGPRKVKVIYDCGNDTV